MNKLALNHIAKENRFILYQIYLHVRMFALESIAAVAAAAALEKYADSAGYDITEIHKNIYIMLS